jgi:PAS domain S-box-containing protein
LNISEGSISVDSFQGFVPAVYEHSVCMVDADGLVTSWKSNIDPADDVASAAIVGQHHSHLFTAEDRARLKPEQILKLARANGGFEEESWRVRRDGSRYWASVVVKPVYGEERRVVSFATIMRDISETRALREALRRSEQRISLIMRSIAGHYAIFVLDVDGIVASWNPAAESTLGYGKRDIIGQHFSCFLCPEDKNGGKDTLMLNAARASGQAEHEGWSIRQDGTRFWARVVTDPIHDEHGECIGFAYVIRDITQQRTIDELEQQLFHSRSGEPPSQATGEIARDFNNLLSAVAVSLDLIKRSDDIGTMHRLTHVAQRAAQAGVRLTAKLLASRAPENWPETLLPSDDLRRNPALPDRSPASIGRRGDSGQITVLVVDDDPDVLELTTCAIQELGYNVRQATDAQAAVAILQSDPTIELLFTDVVMPSSISDMDLARRARELNPRVRILLTSGYPRLQNLHDLDDGMAFIPKPYKVSTLDEKLRELTA